MPEIQKDLVLSQMSTLMYSMKQKVTSPVT